MPDSGCFDIAKIVPPIERTLTAGFFSKVTREVLTESRKIRLKMNSDLGIPKAQVYRLVGQKRLPPGYVEIVSTHGTTINMITAHSFSKACMDEARTQAIRKATTIRSLTAWVFLNELKQCGEEMGERFNLGRYEDMWFWAQHAGYVHPYDMAKHKKFFDHDPGRGGFPA